jgi:hypothetical protein
MLTPHEQALMDYLVQHFDRIMLTSAPAEPSVMLLIRTAARVLATETAARGLSTEALPGLVDHYWQLFDTWLREALAEVQAQQQRGRDDA